MPGRHHRHILITGPPGVGKTTLIASLVDQLPGQAAGFYTREIRAAAERRTGFEIVSLTGRKGVMAHIDLKSRHRVGKYGVDIQAIEAIGVQSLRQGLRDPQVKFIIIDEIAKMELVSKQFRQVVLDAFNSPKQVIATIQYRPDAFLARLRNRPDVMIFHLTRANRDQMGPRILAELSTNGHQDPAGQGD